jgi:hypothetical protein
MFGSLVIAFPTPHEGGALVFRHAEKEWTLDSGALLGKQTSPHIAYATFFSDVEHEVLPVVSGHRVTITYNLYWGQASSPNIQTTELAEYHHSLITSLLESALRDSTLLPNGGWLAFGLRHQYPITSGSSDAMMIRLKGGDAALARLCRDMGLTVSTKLVYDSNNTVWYEDKSDDEKRWFLLDTFPEPEDTCEEFSDVLASNGGVQIQGKDTGLPVKDCHWVTERTTTSRTDQRYITYGNEVSTRPNVLIWILLNVHSRHRHPWVRSMLMLV